MNKRDWDDPPVEDQGQYCCECEHKDREIQKLLAFKNMVETFGLNYDSQSVSGCPDKPWKMAIKSEDRKRQCTCYGVTVTEVCEVARLKLAEWKGREPTGRSADVQAN